MNTSAPDPAGAARPSRRLWAALLAYLAVFGGAGYAWLGHPQAWQIGPQGNTQVATPHAMDTAQFQAMAARLAERLKAQPDDPEGWAMLGRSYSVLGQPEAAVAAFRRVVALRAEDAQAHADLADALAGLQQGRFEGEPIAEAMRALQLDPSHVKALALAGTAAYRRGDRAAAAQFWERALAAAEPGSRMAAQLQGALEDARGGPVAPGRGPGPSGSDAAAASVRGRVRVAAPLLGHVPVEATLFIFARPLQGSRAPLAILRRQVKDLPLDFTLDDGAAMDPGRRLSEAGQFVVGARISRSGEAMPHAGDLEGLSVPVAAGAQGVQIEIDRVLP